MRKITLVFITILFLASCKKDNDKSGTFKGAEVAVFEGKGWSSVKIGDDNAPEQLMITLTDAVLNSVSANHEHSGGGAHQHENSIVLPLHQKMFKTTPFKHISVDWNAEGHPPAGVYTLPHFDFHFYMVTEGEVRAATDPAKLENDPPAGYLPLMHVPAGSVPQMGKHWADVTSPELSPTNPQVFTQTFIYGSYNGKVTFYEPMITLAFLKNTTHFERSIPQPQKFQQAGYYPTKMRIAKHNGVTDIILEGFTYRQAS